jgi:predicted nucleic acid-binding protein
VPVLLDTGALELLRRRDLRVESLVLKHYPPVLCPHVAGEFIHSQLQARVSKAAIVQARTFVAAFEVLAPTMRTADVYADLCEHLAARDIILSDAAYWIAAHALEHHLLLLTTDRGFRQVSGLNLHLLHSRFIRVAGHEKGARVERAPLQ